jgi:hypothetical protein
MATDDFDLPSVVCQGIASADGESLTGYANVSSLPTSFASSVDFYTICDQGTTLPSTTETTDATFNSMGDPVLYQQWKKFSSLGASSAANRISPIQLANPTALILETTVAWATPDPTTLDTLEIINRTGYQVTDACALLDFSDSFSYVAL